jgi:hypothetical protein
LNLSRLLDLRWTCPVLSQFHVHSTPFSTQYAFTFPTPLSAVNWSRLSLLLSVCVCLCSAQPQPQPEMVRDIRAGTASSISKGERRVSEKRKQVSFAV